MCARIAADGEQIANEHEIDLDGVSAITLIGLQIDERMPKLLNTSTLPTEEPYHQIQKRPAEGGCQYGRRWRAYRNSLPGERRRVLIPPCGSPLNSTTKSVPLPVSELTGSSVTIRDDRGAIPTMRSNASCGIMIRSSAAPALSDSAGDGSTPRVRPCGRCGSIAPGKPPPLIETTLHRKLLPSVARSMAVKMCVPIGRSEFAIVTGLSKIGSNACRT